MAQKLMQTLSQKIDFNRLTLYQNLTLYDDIIKQLNIHPTDPAALSAYQLICREYINPKTPSQSSKGPSSPQNTISMDINDPEVMGQFSFAKKPRNLQQMQREVRPQKLFQQKKQESENKGLSEQIKSKHNNMKFTKNYVSNFQLPIVDLESEDFQKEDWKEKSRKKLEDVENKEAQAVLMLKSRYFEQLLSLMRVEKKVIVKQLRNKSAIFLNQSFLLRKGWKVLKNQYEESKKAGQLAKEFREQKDEIILQQFFLAWKQRALMTEAEKLFETQINYNYEKLAKLRLFRNLRANHQILKLRESQIQQKQAIISTQHKNLQRKAVLRQLINNNIQNKDQRLNYQTLCSVIKLKEMELCLNIMRKMKLREEVKEKKRIKKMQKYIYGFNFIKKLSLDYEIGKVYWKNPQKIIFLKMAFEAISDSLSRQGYHHQWMEQLPLCLAKTDKKLNNCQKLNSLSRIFSAFKHYLALENQKIKEVKGILGRRVLRQLIGNYKIQMLKEKERCQLDKLNDILYQNKVTFGLKLFLFNFDRYSNRKETFLKQKLLHGKIKTSFIYLNANRVAKKYYCQKLQKFQLKLEGNLQRRAFYGFRQIALTQIVNKRIVQQFQEYRNIVMKEAIFCCLKGFTAQQRQLKRRLQNLSKIRLSSYFSLLTFNMRVAMYGSYKERSKQLKLRTAKVKSNLQQKMLRSFLSGLKKNKLSKVIGNKIDQQYNHKLKYKAFSILKVISQKQLEQKSKSLKIRQISDKMRKKQTMGSLVNTFLLILMLKNADNIAKRMLRRVALQKMKGYCHFQQKEASFRQIEIQKP